jgi:long-chain acyl-CoA synthetase
MFLLHHLFEYTASRLPDKQALVCHDRRLTYRELFDESRRLARGLHDLGVGRQDRVVVFMDNEAEAVISMIGILMAGGVFVILNGSMKGGKLAYILKDSGARALITSTGKARVVLDALGELREKPALIWKGDAAIMPPALITQSTAWNDALCPTSDSSSPLPGGIDQDLAALIYTSGSTGEPKGVMSPHYSMISAARSIIQYLGNRETDVILNVLPLSFDYGLYQVIMSLIFGGTVILEKSFLYIHPILKRIEEERVTGFPMVPTILAMMLNLQDLKKYDFASLRYVTNTGAALPVEHIRKLRSILPKVRIYSMFGLTECKRVCYLPFDQLDQRPDSVGKAIPNCEVWIEDASGRHMGPDETGELVIRGSNVMRGYWNAPELTAKYFRPGRNPGEMVLYSGDQFKMDAEGYLYFIGRKDEMIKCKGERVSPKEIENVLCGIPGIEEAAVLGISDGIEGQSIAAFIVSAIYGKSNEKEIRKHCVKHLEPFAVPKYVEFLDELPRTAHGKVDKQHLAQLMNKLFHELHWQKA